MTASGSPWRFLTALDGGRRADRDLLKLTRDEELQSITDMVACSRTSLLYATSGNGKSSIVNAGVAPFFAERGYAVLKTRPRPPACTDNPSRAFKQCLVEESRAGVLEAFRRCPLDPEKLTQVKKALEEIPGAGKLTEMLETSAWMLPEFTPRLEKMLDQPLPVFVRGLQDLLPAGTPLLLICDQFEELFVHFSNRSVLTQFVDELGAIWADSTLDVRLLFSMREDWVGSMVEFRRTIPTVFNSYFKLNPLRRTAAAGALEAPLKTSSPFPFRFADDAVQAILDDLVQSYMRMREFGEWGAFSKSLAGQEAYIELPALQIIAEKMWETRTDPAVKAPFSKEHYLWLGKRIAAGGTAAAEPPDTRTVADLVLDGYLNEYLTDVSSPNGSVAKADRDLSLDCLYALTDGTRHRRALGENELLQQVIRLRLGGGESVPVNLERLKARLEKLQQGRLLVVPDPQARQWELAHDFAVRATVLHWRQVDRARLGDLVLKNEQQKLSATISRRIDRWWLALVPVALTACWLWSVGFAISIVAQFRLNELIGFGVLLPSALIAFGAGVGMILLSFLEEGVRLKIGSCLTLVALVAFGFVWIKFDPSYRGYSNYLKFSFVGEILGVHGAGVLLCLLTAYFFRPRIFKARENQKAGTGGIDDVRLRWAFWKRECYWTAPLLGFVFLALIILSF